MKIKYLISDLDGTLLFRHDIHQEDIDALKRFKEDGYHLWISTGRGYDSYQLLNNHGIYPEQLVGVSGALVCDDKMNVEYLTTISHDDARHLFAFLESNFPHLDYSLSTNQEKYHFARIDAGNIKRHLPGYIESEVITPYNEFFNHDYQLLRLFCVGDSNEYCYQVKVALEKEFNGRLIAMKTDETCIDIMPKDCNKWNGVQTLLNRFGISTECVAAIGDQETDMGMISHCKLGFAMQSSDQSVKDSADYVVNSVHDAIDIIYQYNRDNE